MLPETENPLADQAGGVRNAQLGSEHQDNTKQNRFSQECIIGEPSNEYLYFTAETLAVQKTKRSPACGTMRNPSCRKETNRVGENT